MMNGKGTVYKVRGLVNKEISPFLGHGWFIFSIADLPKPKKKKKKKKKKQPGKKRKELLL